MGISSESLARFQNLFLLNDFSVFANYEIRVLIRYRHVISILGEGCFGQVWKCQALNIAGLT